MSIRDIAQSEVDMTKLREGAFHHGDGGELTTCASCCIFWSERYFGVWGSLAQMFKDFNRKAEDLVSKLQKENEFCG